MSEHDEALALLRARFPEPWMLSFNRTPDYDDRLYAIAALPGRRVPDFAVRVEGECMPDSLSAARACIAAWDAATKECRRMDYLAGWDTAMQRGWPSVMPSGRWLTGRVTF